MVSLAKLIFMTSCMSLIGMVFAGAPITLQTHPIYWLISIVVSAQRPSWRASF